MTQKQQCPEIEVLAAFLDGKLADTERREVLEHLDRCERCYAVFTETAQFLSQEADEGSPLIPTVPSAKQSALTDDEEPSSATNPEIGDLRLRMSAKPLPKYFRAVYAILAAAALIVMVLVISRGLEPDDFHFISELERASMDNPLGRRVDRVLQRLVSVAELPPGLEPNPQFFIGSDQVDAFPDENGSIYLSQTQLESLFTDVDPEWRDAGLAFVLGHELWHLKNKEYFHAFAANPATRGRLGESNAKLHEIELNADRHGYLYAVLAGFRPDLLLDGERDFFCEMGRAITVGERLSDASRSGNASRLPYPTVASNRSGSRLF